MGVVVAPGAIRQVVGGFLAGAETFELDQAAALYQTDRVRPPPAQLDIQRAWTKTATGSRSEKATGQAGVVQSSTTDGDHGKSSRSTIRGAQEETDVPAGLQ